MYESLKKKIVVSGIPDFGVLNGDNIVGIGIDLVEVVRIERTIKKWRERFLKRIFTPVEIAYCRKHVNEELYFSARFAAKEALRKAIGQNVRWTDMEILNEASGKPVVKLAKGNLKWHIFLSMSHTEEYAVAYVIIQNVEPMTPAGIN